MPASASDSPQPTLKRGLSLSLLTLYGLGNILGAGIYVLVGKVAGVAGMLAPAAFLVASVVAGLTALTYRELAVRFPLSAGEAVYVQEGFGWAWLSRLVGLMIVLMGAVSASTMTRGFVGYLQVFLPVPDALAISLLMLLLTVVAIWGVRESVGLAALFTLVEVGGLLLVIWVGGDALAQLPERYGELLPPAEATAWSGVLLGAFLAFYAFIGFEDMVNVAEEVRRPARTLPLAIVLALSIATLLYFGISTLAVLVVPPQELASSDAPLATVYARASGQPPVVLGLVGMFAVVNGALIQIIMASRVLYGMSRQAWLPGWLGRVAGATRTPVPATLVAALVIWLFALWLPLVVLAQFTSLLVLLVFALVNLALLRVKRRQPETVLSGSTPPWVPVLGVLSCLFLVGFQLRDWWS
jgi:amino acid transporter